MNEKLPKPTRVLQKEFPKVWKSFQDLGKECHAAGPLPSKTPSMRARTTRSGTGGVKCSGT